MSPPAPSYWAFSPVLQDRGGGAIMGASFTDKGRAARSCRERSRDPQRANGTRATYSPKGRNETMKTNTNTNTNTPASAPRAYVAINGIRLYGAGLQRAKQTDGKATGYVLALLNSKDKDGARTTLEPFAEMIKEWDALTAGVYNKYTQVYANRDKALRVCADFASRFLKDGNGNSLILDSERADIEALNTEKGNGGDEKGASKSARKGEPNYCTRLDKALKGSEGISRVNILLAALEECEIVKNIKDAKMLLDAFADVAIARVQTEAAIKAATEAARVKGESEKEAKDTIIADAIKARKARARALADRLATIAEEE